MIALRFLNQRRRGEIKPVFGLFVALSLLIAGAVSVFPHLHFTGRETRSLVEHSQSSFCSTCELIHLASAPRILSGVDVATFEVPRQPIEQLFSDSIQSKPLALISARAPPIV